MMISELKSKIDRLSSVAVNGDRQLEELAAAENRVKEQQRQHVDSFDTIQGIISQTLQSHRDDVEKMDGELEQLRAKENNIKFQLGIRVYRSPPCHVCQAGIGHTIFNCPQGHLLCESCAANSCQPCSDESGRNFRNHALEQLVGQYICKSDPFDASKEMAPLRSRLNELMEMKEEANRKAEENVSELKEEMNMEKAKENYLNDELENLKKKKDAIISHVSTTMAKLNILKEKLNSLHKMDCRCGLGCHHPLVLDNKGRIHETACTCQVDKERPCLCVTHILDFTVGLGSTTLGTLRIDLAGRYNPRTAYRFFKAANNNRYANTVFNYIVKNTRIDGGSKTVDDQDNFVRFSDNDALKDSMDSFLPPQKYFVGYWNGDDEMSNSIAEFSVLLGGENQDFRIVGQVVDGVDIIDTISNLAVEDFVPLESVTIKHSKARINTDPTIRLSVDL